MALFNVPGVGLIAPGTPFTLNDFKHPANWLELTAPEDLAVLGITVEPDPEAAPYTPTQADYEAAIEAHVNTTAKERQYRSDVSCVSYISSTIPQWAAEAAAFNTWRDQVWAYAYNQLYAVAQGQRTQPTIPALIAELPAITWPAPT
jgi:hypothetical protein